MRSSTLVSITTVVLALASTAAPAAEQRTSAMLWASALEGSFATGGGSADINMSLEEILNVLDGSITLRHESRDAARGWYAEFVYNDLKKDASGAAGERQLNMQQTIIELGMSKPIADDWEVYGGARWETLDNSIDFIALPSQSTSIDWADAVLGVRWQRASSSSRLWLRGDVAGGGSDGAFLFETGGAWRFAQGWEFMLAFRAFDSSYDDGSHSVDLLQSGAIIGVTRDW
jgi:hypothetical protein